jgi:SpoVK/Ycf46/Vps4 family AAA+-type ATPase
MKKESQQRALAGAAAGLTAKDAKGGKGNGAEDDNPLPPELAHCEKALVEKIESEIVHQGQSITFDEIAGLEFAKKTVDELICWPMARPDLFQGLRALPRGLLLFGPPGTGEQWVVGSE